MKTLVAAIVAAIFMTGCAPAAEDTAPAPVVQSPDDYFIETLEKELPQYPVQDEDMLIDAGRSVCTYFEDNGVSLLNLGILSNEFASQGFSNEETAKIFVISTTAYCPEIKDEILSLNTGGI